MRDSRSENRTTNLQRTHHRITAGQHTPHVTPHVHSLLQSSVKVGAIDRTHRKQQQLGQRWPPSGWVDVIKPHIRSASMSTATAMQVPIVAHTRCAVAVTLQRIGCLLVYGLDRCGVLSCPWYGAGRRCDADVDGQHIIGLGFPVWQQHLSSLQPVCCSKTNHPI